MISSFVKLINSNQCHNIQVHYSARLYSLFWAYGIRVLVAWKQKKIWRIVKYNLGNCFLAKSIYGLDYSLRKSFLKLPHRPKIPSWMSFSLSKLWYSNHTHHRQWISQEKDLLNSSDEFELKFPELSRAELKRFRAELSQAGAFQFQAETKLTICISILGPS